MAHIEKLNINGDPNIGLYGLATDKFCLLGKSAPKKIVDKIREALAVPIIQGTIYGTDFFGIFAVANSSVVLVPDIIFNSEKTFLKKELAKLGVKLETISTDHTALNNNITTNDKNTIISTIYNKSEVSKIKKILKTKIKQTDIAKTTIPGSLAVITNKGAILTTYIEDREIRLLEKFLGFEIGIGTVNMGNPFVKSGIIANSHGFIIGIQTSGYEIARIDESLGFIKT